MAFLSFDGIQHPLHKEWKLVAEQISYFNLDHTKYEGARDRLDSVKNVTVQFLADGSFKSPEGNGTYTLSQDSIHLNLNDKSTSFKYELNNSKLIIESYFKKSTFMVRSRLYLE